MPVENLLKRNGSEIVSIESKLSVADAIDEMAQNAVSALIVMQDNHPIGIFAERDVLRCHLQNKNTPFNRINIKAAMTKRLIVADADDEISTAMAMMIQAGIRHLPVMKNKSLRGMLTISDLVKHQIGTLTAEVHYLQEYISDLHEAGLD